MGQAKSRGTREQRMSGAQQRDHSDTGAFDTLERFLGFDRLRTKDERPLDLPEDALVCMASNIAAANQVALREQSGLDFQLGDWFVSSGAHDNTKIHGPFPTVDAAFEFARVNFGAVRFVSLA
jgi:hypothetical protein